MRGLGYRAVVPGSEPQQPRAVPCDYDTDPGRWAANQAFRSRPGAGRLSTDAFGMVARRILARSTAGPVLELGGGTGPLARELAGHGVRVIVADLAAMLSQAPRPAVWTDARVAGFQDESFGTVAALWMLYHLPDPALALGEARRVLRPGGCLVACAPSRFNDPELAQALPGWGEPLTFDAENAASQVGRFFQITDTVTWDVPLIDLTATGDVACYLRGRGMTGEAASRAAGQIPVPVRLTKRGALIWARKPPATATAGKS
jgi:SAM-dependent methyltransferase